MTSTLQSASLPNSNLTPDEQKALKRLKTDENIVILHADKGRVTVVMDKTDYNDKMDSLVNDKQTYEVLKRDPTPALQRKLNNKLLTLKKTDKIDFRRYNRLRCSVPQPPKLYGLPKLHKPNIPMRPIVSFCGSPTYQLSKYLTNVLKPLTDESRHKLQSTENFIDAIKTIQIPDDHKLVSFQYSDFRAEKRSEQASAHPLLQAQGGLFCVLTVFVCSGVLSEVHEVRTFSPCK